MSVKYTRRTARIVLAATGVVVSLAFSTSSAAAAPHNDNFGRAIPLKLGTRVHDNINGATRQRGEPRHADSLAARSVWYSFRATGKTTVILGTCTSSFDTVVAVYTGRTLRALRAVDFNNDGCGEDAGGSRVSFTARSGRTYRIAVAGFQPRGRFTLTVSRLNAPPNDDFVDAAPLALGSTLAGTLRNSTRELHEPVFVGETSTVWFRLRTTRTRRVEVSACGSVPNPYLAVYTGRRLSRLRRIAGGSDDCDVQFTASADVTYRIQATMEPELQGPFRIRARAIQ